MRGAVLALILVLAGCAGPVPPTSPLPGGAAPARVVLYRDTMTAEMADRSLCVVPRPGRGREVEGRLLGCPSPYPVRVSYPQTMPPRVPLRRGASPPLVVIETPSGPVAYGRPAGA